MVGVIVRRGVAALGCSCDVAAYAAVPVSLSAFTLLLGADIIGSNMNSSGMIKLTI